MNVGYKRSDTKQLHFSPIGTGDCDSYTNTTGGATTVVDFDSPSLDAAFQTFRTAK